MVLVWSVAYKRKEFGQQKFSLLLKEKEDYGPLGKPLKKEKKKKNLLMTNEISRDTIHLLKDRSCYLENREQ